MSNMGVFGWIRESVRQSVLLGFSDAVQQLGTSTHADEPLHPKLAAMLQEVAPATITEQRQERPASKPERKRLGRSLEQLRQPNSPKTADGTA